MGNESQKGQNNNDSNRVNRHFTQDGTNVPTQPTVPPMPKTTPNTGSEKPSK